MADSFGPSNAANAVTTRPAETRTQQTSDTWFKDCSSPTARDGTQVPAAWLNQICAALRALQRGNGNKTDGVTPIVADNDADDYMLLEAVENLIQRGRANYCRDSGAVNALVITLTPAPSEFIDGMLFWVVPDYTTTATNPTIKINGTTFNLVDRDGAALLSGAVVAGRRQLMWFDGSHVRVADAPGSSGGGGGFSLTIGTITTGAAGTNAEADLNGSSGSNYVLNMTIPEGSAGSQGVAGATGATGAQGAGWSFTYGGVGSVYVQTSGAQQSGLTPIVPERPYTPNQAGYAGTWQSLGGFSSYPGSSSYFSITFWQRVA